MRGRKKSVQLQEFHDFHLPLEIWSQILARLPPKTLMQFRCVCRDWCSLIDQPDFISMHSNLYRNRKTKTPLLIVESKLLSNSLSLRLNFALRRSDTFRRIAPLFELSEIYWCCQSSLIHGLMLISSHSDYLTLLNPCIRKSLTLPCCPLKIKGNYTYCCCLGYVKSQNDYKVVVFDCVDGTDFELAIAVCSLRDRCWRVKRLQVPEWCWEDVQLEPVYVRGAVYWRPTYSIGAPVDAKIMSFHFDSEELRYMKLPDIVEEEMSIFLFAFGGSLAVFGISSVRSCIWALDENQQWSQFWRQDNSSDACNLFQKIRSKYPQILYIEDTCTLLVRIKTKLVAYNIISNKTQRLSKALSLRQVDTYVESLVLHKGYEGVVSI